MKATARKAKTIILFLIFILSLLIVVITLESSFPATIRHSFRNQRHFPLFCVSVVHYIH